MPHEPFPESAIDLERDFPETNAAPPALPPGSLIANLLPSSAEPTALQPMTALDVARHTPEVPRQASTDSLSRHARANESLPNLSHAAPNLLPVHSAVASVPQLSVPNDLSRSLAQQIDTTVRVQRELKIEIKDDVEQLAARTGEYLTAQLDQRDAQLLERIAQQLNQHPTRQATFTGPNTTVGS